jgi:hypothetical protein
LAALLVFLLMRSSPSYAGIVVNCSDAGEPVAAAAPCGVAVRTDLSGRLAMSPDPEPQSSPARGTPEPQASRVLAEVVKQTIDQPGHFLIGAAPIWASRYLIGVPWYGWVVAPLLAYREWLQWPSRRWWDPPLDWTFLSLGAAVATWRRPPRWPRVELRSLRWRIAR